MFSNVYRQELRSRHYWFARLAAIDCGVIISRDILTPWIRFTSDMSVTSTNLYKVRPRMPDYFLPSSLRSSARSRYALACDLPYLIDCFGNRLGGRLYNAGLILFQKSKRFQTIRVDNEGLDKEWRSFSST